MQQIINTVSLLKFQLNVHFLSVIFKKTSQDHFNQKHIVIFKNRNVQLTVEISKTDSSRDQTIANDKLPAFRVELNIFTRFVFKLVFRVVEEVWYEVNL